MTVVNTLEAKNRLSELLRRVEAGEEVVIARAGKAVARLVPADTPKPRRQGGGWKGKVWMADDFDAPLSDEMLRLFEEGEAP